MALKASELIVGDTFEECIVDDLTRTQLVQYAGASGDYNPIHTDSVFATAPRNSDSSKVSIRLMR